MDNITHVVLGAAIGEAISGRRLGKKAMLWGAITGNIPDVDVFLAVCQSVPDSLLSHRGFTHSILFCVMASLLFSWWMKKWKRSGSDDFNLWLLIFSTGLFSHILIDACTSYGTGWYEPFSHYRVSFNAIFVVDPFYTIPMLISFIALLWLKRGAGARKWWNATGFSISTAYLILCFVNKTNTDNIVEKDLRINPPEYVTTPTPFNNLLWYIMLKDTAGFYIGYHSVLDKTPDIDLHYVGQHKDLLSGYLDDKGVNKLIRFSQGYYCVTSDSLGQIDFHDLRFGQIGGWSNPNAPFSFSYHFGRDANNTMVIQRGRINVANNEAFQSLIQRIKGR